MFDCMDRIGLQIEMPAFVFYKSEGKTISDNFIIVTIFLVADISILNNLNFILIE